MELLAKGQTISFSDGPLLMGIVNVTPDSFFDGGRFLDPQAAVAHAWRLVEEGADLLDIGGDSTRPGSVPVDEREERRRLIPVVTAVAKAVSVPISVDTSKAVVAKAAIDAGAPSLTAENSSSSFFGLPCASSDAASFGVTRSGEKLRVCALRSSSSAAATLPASSNAAPRR